MKRYSLAVTGVTAGLMVSCVSESPENFDHEKSEGVIFNAKVIEDNSVKTRFDSAYIEIDKYDTNFYIELCCDEESGEPFTETGTYVIPSGYSGRLGSKVDNEALNWHDLTSPHTFYGWTIPWSKDYYANGKPTTDPIIVTFENSFDTPSDQMGENFNNKILETFIGSKSGPYTYNTHGRYVDMTYFHLVSKIKIGTFKLTETTGAIQRNLKAEITFINMPTSGKFYPHPSDNSAPYLKPDTPNPNSGITYYISNKPEEDESDIFYISPETDFSQISYQVKLTNINYASYSTYYGTFDTVEFVRNGEDFDSKENNDSKILHAGEMMTININLIPGVGPGISLLIDKWSTDGEQKAQYHTYPGLYSEAEMKALLNGFLSQQLIDGKITMDGLQQLYETYGHKNEKGEMVFDLFENMDISEKSALSDGNILPVWKDYILNGLGHTVKMKTNSWSHVFNSDPYYNVGPVRDIYLTDTQGNNTIYIDNDGFVWIYNATANSFDRTENQLTPLEDNKYSYNIDALTGQVVQATYYNNQTGLNQ